MLHFSIVTVVKPRFIEWDGYISLKDVNVKGGTTRRNRQFWNHVQPVFGHDTIGPTETRGLYVVLVEGGNKL